MYNQGIAARLMEKTTLHARYLDRAATGVQPVASRGPDASAAGAATGGRASWSWRSVPQDPPHSQVCSGTQLFPHCSGVRSARPRQYGPLSLPFRPGDMEERKLIPAQMQSVIGLSEHLLQQYHDFYRELNVPEYHRTLERLKRAIFHPPMERKQETSQESIHIVPVVPARKGRKREAAMRRRRNARQETYTANRRASGQRLYRYHPPIRKPLAWLCGRSHAEKGKIAISSVLRDRTLAKSMLGRR